MSSHDITTVDSEGNRHRHRGGVYIPRAKEKKRMERLMEKRASGRAMSASAHAQRNSHASVWGDDGRVSLIGGMKARGIKAQTYVMQTHTASEMSDEERHKIWQPPCAIPRASRARALHAIVLDPRTRIPRTIRAVALPQMTSYRPRGRRLLQKVEKQQRQGRAAKSVEA